jgi:ATP-dependent exoDNAse (exonuclease V) alpha subunit
MVNKSLSNYFQKYNLTNSQSELVNRLEAFIDAPNSSQNIFLLKGYAGTGKTFITKGLTEYLKEIRRTFILAAPTGKAAKVIANKTQNEAYTIHKTIYSTNDVKEYKENENDKTFKFYFDLRVNDYPNNTIYIIDEASMISNVYGEPEFFRFGSGFLLQDLLKYINIDCNDHNKKIIFIGDNAQLPPIGMNFSPALDVQYLKQTFNV